MEPMLDLTKFDALLLLIIQQTCIGFDITSCGMQIVSSLAEYLIRCIILEASRVARYNPPHTLTPVQIQATVRHILPAGLARDAVQYAEFDRSPFQENVALFVKEATLELLQPAWNVTLGANVDRYVAGHHLITTFFIHVLFPLLN